ncbi:MAG: bifunctional diaminohydroxyphosphoribosylaminopyrimidine deaminase/5-amino-6-(5-phosphoribosylamino)uracil reductase RibD [Planctomycetota bacterium]
MGRVVAAMRDPFPRVDGGGFELLRSNGIPCDVDLLEAEARDLLAPYLKRLRTGTPWIIAKWAMTADGKTATAGAESQWISGAVSRRHVHLLRARMDAVIAGAGTVIADDPMLNARLAPEDSKRLGRTATRVIICRQTLPPLASKVFQTADQTPTLLFAGPTIAFSSLDEISDSGTLIHRLESSESTEMIEEVMLNLGKRGMTNVMIEGGPGLMASFLANASQPSRCLVDEWHIYVGPKVFGGGTAPGPIAGGGIEKLADAPQLRLQMVDRFEDDVRLIYRRRADQES